MHYNNVLCVIDLCAWLSLLWMLINLCCVSIFSFFLSLSLSLSLSNKTSLWHPNKRNPLWLGTLVMVLGHPLLLFLLFHLISGSVMRRLRRTSLKTSRNVVFIRNARLFCRILPILLSPKSFKLRIGNLYLRNPWGVPSYLFRNFTPTCTASIPDRKSVV